jgi:hypothetical protein
MDTAKIATAVSPGIKSQRSNEGEIRDHLQLLHLATGPARTGIEVLPPTTGSRAPKIVTAPTKQARHSDYTSELAELICDRLAEGRTLRDVCRDNDIPVDERTVRRWAMNPRNPFSEQFELARTVGLLSMAEEMLEIADDGSKDWGTREGRRGEKVRILDYEHVERAKLRIETRKWLLTKALPKLFGRHMPMRSATGDSQSGGSAFIVFLKHLDSDLNALSRAWQRVRRGEPIASELEYRLLAMYEKMGSPTLRDLASPQLATQVEQAALLERFEVAQLACFGGGEDADEKH